MIKFAFSVCAVSFLLKSRGKRLSCLLKQSFFRKLCCSVPSVCARTSTGVSLYMEREREGGERREKEGVERGGGERDGGVE